MNYVKISTHLLRKWRRIDFMWGIAIGATAGWALRQVIEWAL